MTLKQHKDNLLFILEVITIYALVIMCILTFLAPFGIVCDLIDTGMNLINCIILIISQTLSFICYCILDEIRTRYSRGKALFRKQMSNYGDGW